jgi:dihydroorotase
MLLLEGGRVRCPATGRDELADVLIDAGVVQAIGRDVVPEGATPERVDCTGAVVAPGLVDLCAHLCDPGDPARETLAGGAAAAAAGGFTTVLTMPDTQPVVDNPALVRDVIWRGGQVRGARILPAGAITMGLTGDDLAEIGLMVEAGAPAIADAGVPVDDAGVLRRALDYARPFDVPVLLRPGEPALERDGVMHEGAVSLRVGLRGVPALAEELGVTRLVGLARLTRARVHLTHVTTARSLDLVRRAKDDGVRVTASAPARNLLLTDEDIETRGYDTRLRVMPPLRPEADRVALLRAAQDGTLDALISDHVPWGQEDKELEFAWAQPGATGLATALRAAWTALDGDLGRVLSLLSEGPGRVLGRGGRLAEGEPADVVVLEDVDGGAVDGRRFGRAHNEPLDGRSLRGRVLATVVSGQLVFRAVASGG